MMLHPLLYVTYYREKDNATINREYEQACERVERAISERNWGLYLGLHRRPYQLDAFMEIENEHMAIDEYLTSREYWRFLAEIWIDLEFPWQQQDEWEEVLSDARPDRLLYMMDPEERDALSAMPERFTVWRGGRTWEGLSWTTDEEKARWFSKRFAVFHPEDDKLWRGEVVKADVIAYLLGRGESEIVVLPSDVIGPMQA